MGREIPKQFIQIAGKPVLMHTLEAFHNYSPKIKIILVLPPQEINYWEELCIKFSFNIPHKIQKGGDTRYASVWEGLKCIEDEEGLVAIHDGVRPLVSPNLIANSFEMASRKGSAIPAVALKDSIRKVENKQSWSVDRHQYRSVQTPQTFKVNLIKTAYQRPQSKFQTDDAGVAEQAGHSINLIEGNYLNLKITTNEDLWVAEALLQLLQNTGNKY